MVSRDGSWTYNKAIYNANDSIKQISDRFHLIKNMTEKCCEVIAKNLANRIQVTITEKHLDEYAEFLMMSKDEKIQLIKEKHSKGMGRMQLATKYHLGLKTVDAYLESKQNKNIVSREQDHINFINKLKSKVSQCLELRKSGKSIREISVQLGISTSSVLKYINPNFKIEHKAYGTDYKGIMPQNKELIFKMHLEGATSKEISNKLKEKGLKVTPDAIRGFILKEKRINKDLNVSMINSEIIDSKRVKQLFFTDDKEKIICKKQLDEIIIQYPIVNNLLTIHKSFKEVILGKDSSKLDDWIIEAKSLNIEEVSSYVNTINNDILAIKNGIDYKTNNGLAEGKVNKLKSIKRVMYGRQSFTLLYLKILMKEHGFYIN